MARLPSGYQELKYIESTGTQWIDTGIPPFDGIIANFMAYIPRSIASRTLFGTGGDNGWGAYMATHALWDNYNDDRSISISSDYTGRITIVKNGRNSTFTTSEGTISYAHGNTYPQDSRTIFLFRKNGSPRSYGIFRLFLFSLSDQNGNFLWLGAPCRRLSDGAIGMYDLVSQSFFGNSGTGEFIAGIPVIEPTWGSGVSNVAQKMMMRRMAMVSSFERVFQKVEYIEGDGTQWIDTEYVPISDTYTISFKIYRENLNDYFMGAKNLSSDMSYNGQYSKTMEVAGEYVNFSFSPGVIEVHETCDGTTYTIIGNGVTRTVPIAKNTNNGSFCIFRANRYFNVKSGRVYWLKIEDSGKVICNLIPCYRKADRVAGLYDVQRKMFFVNKGTGADFTIGPEIN